MAFFKKSVQKQNKKIEEIKDEESLKKLAKKFDEQKKCLGEKKNGVH